MTKKKKKRKVMASSVSKSSKLLQYINYRESMLRRASRLLLRTAQRQTGARAFSLRCCLRSEEKKIIGFWTELDLEFLTPFASLPLSFSQPLHFTGMRVTVLDGRQLVGR